MSYIRQVTQEKGLSMRALSILKLRSAIGLTIFSVLIFGSLIAKADVIAERKANFKANAAAMKAINAALGGGDFDAAITQATTIADWARVMPDYFPENSDMGDTKARADIWMDFDGFKSRASANEKAALTLISTAKTGDVSATIGALKQLGGTCKSCHDNFKD
jgi:cytochrome c556|tara:strand:+ start:1061 stop:1549 length:489 start_codon:yes stop_codon:yes gene_type:complete